MYTLCIWGEYKDMEYGGVRLLKAYSVGQVENNKVCSLDHVVGGALY